MGMQMFTSEHFDSFSEVKVPTGEVAATPSRLTGFSFLPYNPDDLVRSRGKGVEIYQEMIRESHVKAPLMQKKTRLLKPGWDVRAASDDPVHQEQAAFVKWNLGTHLAGAFYRDLYEMLDALDCGFSINEKVFEIVNKGKWRGKAAYKNIKSKNPKYFDFDCDDYGNLKKDGLLLSVNSLQEKRLPKDKFIIFSYMMRYENLYGNADLRAAYRAYWIKDTAWKLRAVYMERFAGNNLKGKYPANDDKARDKLLALFRTWQQETGIAIPENCEVEVLNMATSSKSEYEASIEDCNKEMQIAINTQILTMDTGERGNGSRALGQVHNSALDDIVWFLEVDLMTAVNLQVVMPIIDLNWDTEDYPFFYIKGRDGFDEEKYSRTLLNLSRIKGLNIPVRQVKDKLKIREPEKGEQVIEGIQLGNSGGGVPNQQQPVATATKPEGKKEEEKTDKMSEPSPTPQPTPLKGEGGYFRELNKFEIFAELPRIDKETEALVREAKEASAPIYRKIFDGVNAFVKKNKLFENPDDDPGKLIKLSINVGELKDHLVRVFLKANLMGQADIRGLVDRFSDKFTEEDEFVTDEELKELLVKIGMTAAVYEKLVRDIEARAYAIAGIEQAAMAKEIRTLILSSILNGDDVKAFRFKLQEFSVKYEKPTYGGIGKTGDVILDYHAETMYRTNVMREYNNGRFKQLQDPDVAEVFPALQLSAIIDGRQRSTHGKADGLVFMADDPIWKQLTPPNGFNCRCTIIPVNAFDFTRDMLNSYDDIPSGYPDPNFK